MAYEVNQVKVFAYNKEVREDFTAEEMTLYNGLKYCYDCFRLGYDKEECAKLMDDYIEFFEFKRKYNVEHNVQKGVKEDG